MKNREMKKLFLNTFLILSILFLTLSFVSSAVTTINSPTTNIVCGNQTFNVNVNSTWIESLINLTFYVGSGSTANTSWTEVGVNNSLNMSLLGNKSVTTIDFINSKVEDSNDYILNVTAINATGDRLMLGDATRTSIRVDCTIPASPSSLSPVNNQVVSSSATQTFTSTVINANTTGCTYTLYRGGSASDSSSASGSALYSSSTCSFTKAFDTSVDNGNYYWTVTASDGTNSSTSAPTLLSVQIAGKSGGLLPGTYTTKEGKTLTITSSGTIGSSPYLIWGIVIGAVILIGSVVFIIRKR